MSSAVNGLNLVITVIIGQHRLSTVHQYDIYLNSILLTSLQLVPIIPCVFLATLLLTADRSGNSNFFDLVGGGDVAIYQHLF